MGDEVNEKYMEVISSVGLNTSTRSDAVAETEEGSRFITFGDQEGQGDVLKVITVKDANVNESDPRVLEELDADEMAEESLVTWPATKYCIYRIGPGYVVIKLNAEAEEDGYEFEAEVEENSAELSGDDEPQFPRPFHDILIHGVMGIEGDKKEKESRGVRAEQRFQVRLSELRYHLATSAHRRFWQGKRPRRR